MKKNKCLYKSIKLIIYEVRELKKFIMFKMRNKREQKFCKKFF